MLSIIAAIGKNRELGKDNQLLWHIPDDLKRFKQLTLGHPVIMGRKTFDSIAAAIGGPLPGRTNIVVTRGSTALTTSDNVLRATSLEDALAQARAIDSEIFVIGGGQLYAQALPQADRLYLTLIDDAREADTFFPTYEELFTKKVFEEDREWNELAYHWIDLEKEKAPCTQPAQG